MATFKNFNEFQRDALAWHEIEFEMHTVELDASAAKHRKTSFYNALGCGVSTVSTVGFVELTKYLHSLPSDGARFCEVGSMLGIVVAGLGAIGTLAASISEYCDSRRIAESALPFKHFT